MLFNLLFWLKIFLLPKTKLYELLNIFFKSILYTQYHCFPLTLNVSKLDSLCHSTNFNNVEELVKIFKHHITGSIQIIISPHFPWLLNELFIFG